MARAWLVLIVSLMGSPILGLAAASFIHNDIVAAAERIGLSSINETCMHGSAAVLASSGGLCEVFWGAWLLKQLCVIALTLTIVLPMIYVVLAFMLARSQEAFARYFPMIVKGALLGLVALLALQGALTLLAAYDFAISEHANRVLLALGAAGLGYLFAAFLVLNEVGKLFEPQLISLTGVEVNERRMPELRARVYRLAVRLGAKAPERIILGLEPTCCVTSAAIHLRGQGQLPPAQTLFLSTMALRVLNEDEIDAVLGHELGHCRGDDLAFSQRFAPTFVNLTRALESVSIAVSDEPAWIRLPKLPAIATLSGIMYVLHRAVSSIGRRRELEADRAALEVTTPTALVTALIKMQAVSPYWESARRENAAVVSQGRFRRNLAMAYLQGVRHRLQSFAGREAAVHLVVSKTSHPLDTHPTLCERAAAVNVDVAPLIVPCLDSLRWNRDHNDALGRVEQELTWIENDFVRPPTIQAPPRVRS